MARWMVQSNIAVHGVRWAAEYAAKHGMCFTLFYWAAFGRAPRKLSKPPMNYWWEKWNAHTAAMLLAW